MRWLPAGMIVLEKEFGNLDELDIDVASKASEELKDKPQKIIMIIYHDKSVTIGEITIR